MFFKEELQKKYYFTPRIAGKIRNAKNSTHCFIVVSLKNNDLRVFGVMRSNLSTFLRFFLLLLITDKKKTEKIWNFCLIYFWFFFWE